MDSVSERIAIPVTRTVLVSPGPSHSVCENGADNYPLTRPRVRFALVLATRGLVGRKEHGAGGGDLAQHGRDRIDQCCDLFADGIPATGWGGGMDRR